MQTTLPPLAEGQPATAADPRRRSGRGRPPGRAWFASDFHLHGADPAGVERACRFVAYVQEQGADALFLLGDVFRAWLGRPSLSDAGLAPFLDELRRAVASGLRVVFIHGNHDFLMGAELEESCGVEVYVESLDIAVRGMRVRLLHGDAFCTRDVGYHRLHRVLRARPMRFLCRVLPRAALDALAGRLVKDATRTTGAKSRMTMAIVDEEVLSVLHTGVDVVVCGHVHEARDDRLGDAATGGRLLVMADFERSGCHASLEGGHIVLHRSDARFGRDAAWMPIVVTLDGPAGSGKSSVARELSRRLGFPMLDSGALYRTVTAQALAAGLDPETDDLGPMARSLDLAVGGDGRVTLSGEPVPDELLRSRDVSAAVSKVSAQAAVREALLPVQQAAGRSGPGLVAEGRDMGTVVFPEAAVRVYLDARLEVRALRRLAQNPGEGRSLDEVGSALAARDARDSGRSHAPLARAEGATLLDTSDLSAEQVVCRLVEMVEAAASAS